MRGAERSMRGMRMYEGVHDGNISKHEGRRQYKGSMREYEAVVGDIRTHKEVGVSMRVYD